MFDKLFAEYEKLYAKFDGFVRYGLEFLPPRVQKPLLWAWNKMTPKRLIAIIIFGPYLPIAYLLADKKVKQLTGKSIHEHAMDCLSPEFKNKIKDWCVQAFEGAIVHFRLLKDEGGVQGKRTLRAIGLWQDATREPVTITEEVITLEQAMALGFDLNVTDDQELEYMVAEMAA
jgi:hypothetical protein